MTCGDRVLLASPGNARATWSVHGRLPCTKAKPSLSSSACTVRGQVLRQGEQIDLHFDPQTFARQVPKAVELCGLKWDESILSAAYDSGCRHHTPAVIAHDAQRLFEQMGGSVNQFAERDNLHKLMADAALREQVLRDRGASLITVEQENGLLGQQVAVLRLVEADLHDLSAKLAVAERENSRDAAADRILRSQTLCPGSREADMGRVSAISRMGRSGGNAAVQAMVDPRKSKRESAIRIFF